VIISREIFNPMYALFTISPGDRVTYMINPSSHCNSNHLFYFKFVGRVIGKLNNASFRINLQQINFTV
jgi:E3 ubiquitin-protein ligase HUWE1